MTTIFQPGTTASQVFEQGCGNGQRVAVVNRGDAAVRLIHAVRELNYEFGSRHQTIALYTEEEVNSSAVMLADDSYNLGPARGRAAERTSQLAYLDRDLLAEALVRTGATAAWVGWGLVSERGEFAELCKELGVVFIGPHGSTMRRLGHKIEAKLVAESAGVPVVPGSGGVVADAAKAAECADRIGYPILLKASAGGGGRGMRTVTDSAALSGAFVAASREAEAAFGDGSLFVEKQIGDARHVEVQVAGDEAGAVWAVGCRDCTVQRRRQKIIEESGIPGVAPDIVDAVEDAALRLVRSAGYTGVGTVEFLLEAQLHAFYFMEVNTRLQVEHTVTEETTGLDLVKLQIGLAFGARLKGSPPPARGSAIEARITTEDPAHGFRPSPGVVEVWEPATGPGLRVDTGLSVGDAVPPEFDPLVAKIIARGSDRAEALARLRRGLADARLVVRDGASTLGFLRALLAQPQITDLQHSTGWVDALVASDEQIADDQTATAMVLAAVELAARQLHAGAETLFETARRGRPEVIATSGVPVDLTARGSAHRMYVHRVGLAAYLVETSDGVVSVERSCLRRNIWLARCGPVRTEAYVRPGNGVVQVVLEGNTYLLQTEETGVVRAPSPSVVVNVGIEVGDRLEAEEPVAVLESMKLETVVQTPAAGIVREVHVQPNEQVSAGAPLVRLDFGRGADTECRSAVSFGALATAEPLMISEVEVATRQLWGFDVGPSSVTSGPSTREQQTELLRLFAATVWLSGTRAYKGAIPGKYVTARDALTIFLRAPELAQQTLPAAFLTDLAATLTTFGGSGSDLSKGLVPYDAAYRLARALRSVSETRVIVEKTLRAWPRAGLLSSTERRVVEGLITTSDEWTTVGDLARALLRGRSADTPRNRAPVVHGFHMLDELIRRAYGIPASAKLSRVGPAVVLDEAASWERTRVIALAIQDVDIELVRKLLSNVESCYVELVCDGKVEEPILHRLAGSVSAITRLTATTWDTPDGEPLYVSVTTGREAETSNLHPATAERLELWRLQNFELDHLASTGDVHLMGLTGRRNADDRRLVVIAGVADLKDTEEATPNEVENTLIEACALIRDQRAGEPTREHSLLNRIVVYVRQSWTAPHDELRRITQRIAPAACGLGIDKILVRVHRPDSTGPLRDRLIHIAAPTETGVRVGESDPSPHPMRTRTPRQHQLLRLHRRGLRDPYEIVDLMVSRDASSSDFPPGRFYEYDLDADGCLARVDRAPGGNAAAIVVGFIENTTSTCPEGMTRVAILSDPSRGLGALAEPECRRIVAALDLATELGVPIEWFSVSAGARVAMDSGTENMDWVASVLRRIVEFTQDGGEINTVVAGVNVGAQPYFNAEATMLMHTKGVLIMTPASSMVLTGKEALDFAGGVSAENNVGIGGFNRIMGPNGQGQLWASTFEGACQLLFDYYERTYVAPEELFPRRRPTRDPVDRDVCATPHPLVPGCDFTMVGDIFSDEHNSERKKPFDMRTLMRAVADVDCEPLERWGAMAGAESTIAWETRIGGFSTTLVGVESQPVSRQEVPAADGPQTWSAMTLFPRSSKKLARALNAASGRRPVVILANLAGFDGSPESLRELQLEYGAEIGRAVVNFAGPILFCVVSRYHGGAFVVFSKNLNQNLEVLAIEGARASVIGGSAAAAVVFAREVDQRVAADPRIVELERNPRTDREALTDTVRGDVRQELAGEFDSTHNIARALQVGSIDRVIQPSALRPDIIASLAARTAQPPEGPI